MLEHPCIANQPSSRSHPKQDVRDENFFEQCAKSTYCVGNPGSRNCRRGEGHVFIFLFINSGYTKMESEISAYVTGFEQCGQESWLFCLHFRWLRGSEKSGTVSCLKTWMLLAHWLAAWQAEVQRPSYLKVWAPSHSHQATIMIKQMHTEKHGAPIAS